MTVWDLPLRLFHWLLVLAIVLAYVTATIGGSWLEWHEVIGVFVLSLIVFRLVWGFVGSTTSRFSQFFPTPARLRQFFFSTWTGVGHSPLGAISVLALLLMIIFHAVLGLFAMNEDADFQGPFYALISSTLSEKISVWHGVSFNALLFLIVLHVCAIFYYLFIKKRNLITPMITGKSGLTKDQATSSELRTGAFTFFIAVSIAALFFWIIESGFVVSFLMPQVEPVVIPDW